MRTAAPREGQDVWWMAPVFRLLGVANLSSGEANHDHPFGSPVRTCRWDACPLRWHCLRMAQSRIASTFHDVGACIVMGEAVRSPASRVRRRIRAAIAVRHLPGERSRPFRFCLGAVVARPNDPDGHPWRASCPIARARDPRGRRTGPRGRVRRVAQPRIASMAPRVAVHASCHGPGGRLPDDRQAVAECLAARDRRGRGGRSGYESS
jgi:hypothetical protein